MVSKSVAICKDYLSCRTHLNRLTEHRTVTRSVPSVSGFQHFDWVENEDS